MQANQLIEIGIIVAGPMDSIDRQAISLAIGQVGDSFSEQFPEFDLRMLRARRPELIGDGRAQPSELLQQAAEDRDIHHWDFAFILTAAELAGVYSPFCYAALSRPLDAAVFSLSLIDPQASGDADQEVRIERIARRLSRLMLHAIGHLTGLNRSSEPGNLLFHPATVDELDAMQHFDEEQTERQRAALAEIADARLEESSGRRKSYPVFAINAAWINRREIVDAVLGARPWEFPRRLSGLTIASVSTVLILFMTAEAWDLGLSQAPASVLLLIALSLCTTTGYVIRRQQLLVRRGRGRSEQTVVTSVSAVAIVFLGMSVTWIALMSIGFCAGSLFFTPELVVNWASSSSLEPGNLGLQTTARMSSFSASVALMIGALGASFESQYHFRHIIYVDEEV
ncbi:hypothetical protein [Stieleria mannarensis]|uniref:hypothetical protein n=1 Tax=Stieleria mannarensis TaxID=2755585 RepID=UPI00336A8693